MTAEILSTEQIQALTGFKRPAQQREALKEKFGISIPAGCGVVVPVETLTKALLNQSLAGGRATSPKFAR